MLNRLVLGAGALSLLVAGSALAQGNKPAKEPKPNTLTAAERKAGWRLLFDGKTTKGWRGYKKDAAPEAWKVVDGVLTFEKAPGKGGDIMTVDQFQDFELSIDWKIAPKGNSGLMYRVAETDGPPYVTGPEYQILDDEAHPDAKNGKDGNRKAGALYDVYAPSKAVARPAGEWNTAKVVVQGKKIEHWLNGEKVLEAEVGSEDWKTRIAASKWAKHERFGGEPKGHIDLQDHGDKVEFRNIKIRDLSQPAKGAAKKQ